MSEMPKSSVDLDNLFIKEFGIKLESETKLTNSKTFVDNGVRGELQNEKSVLESNRIDESYPPPPPLLTTPHSLLTPFDGHSGKKNSENGSNNQIKVSDTRKQLKKVKKEFFEWSLLTKFDCFSKIFEYKHVVFRILWTLIFLAYTGVTFWLVITNITGYYQHEVTTRTEIKNEVPSEFPTVIYYYFFCNQCE